MYGYGRGVTRENSLFQTKGGLLKKLLYLMISYIEFKSGVEISIEI